MANRPSLAALNRELRKAQEAADVAADRYEAKPSSALLLARYRAAVAYVKTCEAAIRAESLTEGR